MYEADNVEVRFRGTTRDEGKKGVVIVRENIEKGGNGKTRQGGEGRAAHRVVEQLGCSGNTCYLRRRR